MALVAKPCVVIPRFVVLNEQRPDPPNEQRATLSASHAEHADWVKLAPRKLSRADFGNLLTPQMQEMPAGLLHAQARQSVDRS